MKQSKVTEFLRQHSRIYSQPLSSFYVATRSHDHLVCAHDSLSRPLSTVSRCFLPCPLLCTPSSSILADAVTTEAPTAAAGGSPLPSTDSRAPGSTPAAPTSAAPQAQRPTGNGGVSPVLVADASAVTPVATAVVVATGSGRQRVTRALGAGVFAEGAWLL